MNPSDAGVKALVTTIARLQKDVRSLSRGSQAAFRSVEISQNPVRYYGSDGEVLGEVVPGPGGIELRPPAAKIPATPTQPDAVGVQGGIVVKWDGTFVGANWDASISHVEVHRSTALDFTPSDQTLVGTFTSYWGGEHWVAATPNDGIQYFRLVTVARSGTRSERSAVDSATALATYVGSDGDAPDTSPAAIVRGGVGALFVSWDPVNNDDPVDYYVHISTVDDFAPYAGTLVTETAATSVVLKVLPNGSPLEYDTIYYVKIIAEDVDGAAPAGAQGGASMMKVTGDDIAVNYVYAGEIIADQITGGTMRSAVTIAGLFQTATGGGRVEMGPFGIRVYDANGIDVNVDLTGAVNRFRGSIDAVDIIIRDALQMFGKNNIMGVGSELALASATAAPAQAPTMAWDYEEVTKPNLSFYLYPTGVSSRANDAQRTYTGVFLQYGYMKAANGGLHQFPPTAPGAENSIFKPYSSIRIANQSTNAERVVAIGENAQSIGSNGYPETYIKIFDDSTITPDGVTGPVLKTQFKMWNFSWLKEYRLVRMVNGGPWKNWFAVYETNTPINGGRKSFTLTQYRLEDNDVNVTNMGAIDMPDLLDPDETLVGGLYGGSTTMRQPDSPGTLMIIMTNKRNLVYNLTTASWVPEASWPVMYNGQDRSWVSGSVVNNDVDGYYAYTWGYSGSDALKAFKYADNFRNGDRTLWASYAWRAEATKAYMTEDSARTSIAYRRGARLRVTVPSLPAPAAGVGQPRDPNVDPYGWVYYMGEGAVEPPNNQLYLQTVQPALVPGVASVQSTISLSTYPNLVGANPVLAATFPTASPARIKSTGNDTNGAPLLLLTGAGLVKGSVFENPSPLADAFSGRAFDQMDFVGRSQLVLNGGNKRTVSQTTGKMYWPNPFIVVGAGRHPNYATEGNFTIAYPTTGTVIPVHNSTVRTSVIAASDGIPLTGDEALWYELPLGGPSASVPGRFHVVGWNSNDSFIPPPGWIFVGARFTVFPHFKWGTGDTDTGWVYLTLANNWVVYNTAIVPSTGARVRVQNDHATFQYAVKSGTAGAQICTIPDNYRPGTDLHPIGRASDGNTFDGPAWSSIGAGNGAVMPGQGQTFYRMLTVTYPAST